MVRPVFVTYVDGRYAGSEEPLVQSIQSRGYDILVFRSPNEIGSPSHQECPYAFKYYSILEARRRGASLVIWCDSCLTLLKPIRPWIEQIQLAGVYLQEDGWKCGMWANDHSLAYFGVSRDDAMTIPSIYACTMAFDFRHPTAHQFLARWKDALDAGCFRGNWTNATNTESQDPRCRGHRHDQTCAELVAHEMKLPLQPLVLNVYLYSPKYGRPSPSSVHQTSPCGSCTRPSPGACPSLPS
jgi:hypothetical protein